MVSHSPKIPPGSGLYSVECVHIWVASFLNLGGRDIKGIMISGQVSLNRPVKTVHLIPSLMTPEHTWNGIAMITPILEKKYPRDIIKTYY